MSSADFRTTTLARQGSTPRGLVRQGLRRLGLLAGFAVIVIAVIVSQGAQAPAGYLLRIPTQDATGIYPGSNVTIAGVNAGTVRNVSLTPGGEAMITADVDPAFAPVHTDATAQIRPKSLLGEMYVEISPGTSGPTLASGATLPQLQVNRSTDLQQVVNTFDQPTRAKLQTLIDELGGGLTGTGGQLNQSIPAGKTDMGDLAAITSTLNSRSQELQAVITTLNTVTTELARSDRRQQLGLLIQSSEQLMANLRHEQAQLQQAVVSADYALGNLNQGLQGTTPALAGIAATLPGTVQDANLLLAPLGTGSRTLIPQLSNLVQGIREGPSVFGGRDASGYATRISLSLGCGSASLCAPLTGPRGGTGTGPRGGTGTGTGPDHGILGFLLGGTP